MTADAEELLRFFNDNVWASIRYVHHQGYGTAAAELVAAGFIEEVDSIYIIKSKSQTELPKR